MTQPRTDHNDLARFLDGGLSEEERSRALAHLSASDEDADVLADAAYLLREMEAEDGVVVADAGEGADVVDPVLASHVPADTDAAGSDPKVIPLRPPSTQRARRRIPRQWMALAAVLAGVLLVPLALSRDGGEIGNPSQLASGLENRDDGVTADWLDRERWSRPRGPGDVSNDDARAARLGALLLDLQLAVDARQIEQTRQLTGTINVILVDVTTGNFVARTYEQVAARAGAPPAELAKLLEDGYENVIALVDKDYFAAGAWTEAAQIAVASQDEAFFRSRATRRAMEDVAELTMPAEAHSALGEIRSASEGDAALNWEALGSATRTLGTELWK